MTDLARNTTPVSTETPLLRFVPESARRVLIATSPATVPDKVKQSEGREVWIIVPDPNDVAAALERFDRVIPCDWSRYIPDLPVNYFDCVIGENLLELADDPLRILNRLASVLRKSGILALAAHNQQYHRYVTALASGRWIPAGADVIPPPGPLRFYTAASLASLVLACPMLDQEACAPLEKDAPEAFPLDASDTCRQDNLLIGPLSPAEYPLWLTRRYLLVCTRNGVPPKW